MRILAFLGAGSMVEIGGPTASQITKIICRKRQEVWDHSAKSVKKFWFLRTITKLLDNYYAPEGANFEDVFHVLEMLDSFRTSWSPGTVKEYKSGITAFVTPRGKKFFDQGILLTAKEDLIAAVTDEVNRYTEDFLAKRPTWFISFWQQAFASALWDIATLNYDPCMEQGIGVALEDGFVNTGRGFYRFDPRQIRSSKMNRILHLHGSILYGYIRTSNVYAYDDDHEDLYRYDNFQDAKATWFGRSTNTAQSREQAIAGPIITGLRKTDKALCFPYNTYYSLFQDSIIENPRLLIAGYSFGDFHFNKMLERVAALHDKNRRVVLITRFEDPTSWHPDQHVMNWPSQEMYMFVAKVFRDQYPFKSHVFTSPLISADGCVHLYLQGFQDALVNHGRQIIDFLTK